MYKSCGFGILFFIIISSLINAQSAYNPSNDLKFNEDNICHIKFYSSNDSSIISIKEKRKIKSLICEHLEMVEYIDSVFEPFDLPSFFSKIPIITSYSNLKISQSFRRWGMEFKLHYRSEQWLNHELFY